MCKRFLEVRFSTLYNPSRAITEESGRILANRRRASMGSKLNPPAGLKPAERTQDEVVPLDLLAELSFFSALKSKKGKELEFAEFPGAVVLRKFDAQRGGREPIIEQDAPGYTAFYVMTTEDMLEWREAQWEFELKHMLRNATERDSLPARIEQLDRGEFDDEPIMLRALLESVARRRILEELKGSKASTPRIDALDQEIVQLRKSTGAKSPGRFAKVKPTAAVGAAAVFPADKSARAESIPPATATQTLAELLASLRDQYQLERGEQERVRARLNTLPRELDAIEQRLARLPRAATWEAVQMRAKARCGARQLLALGQTALAQSRGGASPPGAAIDWRKELHRPLADLSARLQELRSPNERIAQNVETLRKEVAQLMDEAAALESPAERPAGVPRLPNDALKLRFIGMVCLVRLIAEDQRERTAAMFDERGNLVSCPDVLLERLRKHRARLRSWQRETEAAAKGYFREVQAYAAEQLELAERLRGDAISSSAGAVNAMVEAPAVQRRIERRLERCQAIRSNGATGMRRVAAVHVEPPAAAGKQSWWRRLWGKPRPAAAAADRSSIVFGDFPFTLAKDATRPVNMLYEGETFGEISCRGRTPRSATVRAVQDCHMLEMLSNVFDILDESPQYQEQTREVFYDRQFNRHLDNHELFRHLNFAARQQLRKLAQFPVFNKGQVILDEHERADDLYLILRGFVKVQQGVSAMFRVDELSDLRAFCRRLVETDAEASGPLWRLWDVIGSKFDAKKRMEMSGAVARTARGQLVAEHRAKLAEAMGAALRDPAIHADDAVWNAWCGILLSGQTAAANSAAAYLWRILDAEEQAAVAAAVQGPVDRTPRAALAERLAAGITLRHNAGPAAAPVSRALAATTSEVRAPQPPAPSETSAETETKSAPAAKPLTTAEKIALMSKKPSAASSRKTSAKVDGAAVKPAPSLQEKLAEAKAAKKPTTADGPPAIASTARELPPNEVAKPAAGKLSLAEKLAMMKPKSGGLATVPPVRQPPAEGLGDDDGRWIDFCRLLVGLKADAPGPAYLVAQRLRETSAWEDVQRLANSQAPADSDGADFAAARGVVDALNHLLSLDGPHDDIGTETADTAFVDQLWAAFCRTFAEPPQGRGRRPAAYSPQRAPLEVRAALRDATDDVDLDEAVRDQVAYAACAILADGQNAAAIDVEAGLAGDKHLSVQQRRRRRNRLVLRAVFPESLPGPISAAPRVLNYRGKGEVIGEIGLMDKPGLRTATCVAFHDLHLRESGKSCEYGVKVDMLRIPGESVREFGRRYGAFQRELERIAENRRRETEERERVAVERGAVEPKLSARFAELGLQQGQQLMLIDLDRCTRCDECVKACVGTHEHYDSGPKRLPGGPFTRLYLDGPRIGRHLVPATCRQCHDPVCLIGCPVGSIHKGDLGQIVIENWCIGCQTCYKNCPYDAIQMHPTGVVQSGSAVVRICGGEAAPDWFQPGYDDSAWSALQTPLYADQDLRSVLPVSDPPCADAPVVARLRHSFVITEADRFDQDRQRKTDQYLLRTALRMKATVRSTWINGRELKGENLAFVGENRGGGLAAGKDVHLLREGRNLAAFELEIPVGAAPDAVLFDFSLLECRDPEVSLARLGVEAEFDEKVIPLRAVVCDLCASHPSKTPACVSACPHDAAWRGDPAAANSPLRRG